MRDKIVADLTKSMKSKDKSKVSVLRMLLSEITYTEKSGGTSKDAVNSYYKRIKKSLKDYPEGEQRSQIEQEIEIIEEYADKKAGREETEAIVDDVLSNSANNNFGVLMKLVISALGAKADGKLISNILKEKLEV